MKRISLRFKFAVLFFLVIAVVVSISFVWNRLTIEQQAEREMLEKSQILAQEMDAVWAFFETNQHQFKTDERGNYELYCVIAAKSVSRFFTSETDYTIHYTNITTRRAADAPDEFETAALNALLSEPDLKEYYAITAYEGNTQVFRYVRPLTMVESCLACHGEPAGELDTYGYAKEGKAVGDLAGAISIIMPIDIYMEGIQGNIWQSIIFFGTLIMAAFAIIFFGVSKFVTAPIVTLEEAAERIEEGDLDIDVTHINSKDEIHDLALRISSMATQLKQSYENLESQVQLRTDELATANRILKEQRVQLEESNLALQETNQYKSDFLAIMSHELRTPLTSILAFVELWEKANTNWDKRELSAAHEIKENGHLLLNMVDNILEMARAEAGKSELINEPVDMVDLINLIEKSMIFLAERRSITLATSVDSDVPIIIADWEKLRRIITNIVANAIKYTQREGSVSVAVHYRSVYHPVWESRFASRSASDAFEKPRAGSGGAGASETVAEGIVIEVADTGIGITEENLPRIFDMFSQLDKSPQKRYSGSGLGLTVVKELVELHGGRIKVESTYKSGSTFLVFIPSGKHDREGHHEDTAGR